MTRESLEKTVFPNWAPVINKPVAKAIGRVIANEKRLPLLLWRLLPDCVSQQLRANYNPKMG